MATRTLRLTEYTRTQEVVLSSRERDALQALIPSLTIAPSIGCDDRYDLTPSSTVGVLRFDDLQVEIAPRLPVERVLFLASYALDPRRWHEHTTEVAVDRGLVEAIIPTFAHHVRRALRHGLLHGYRSTDETLSTIRGRIRIGDQLRKRPGQVAPTEVTYDDFTPDILENRLLLAAIDRLLRTPLRSMESRRTLLRLREQLGMITPTPFRANSVPEPHWTRLNERYRPAVTIARLILQGSALDVVGGGVRATGVVLDMATVFEDFVVVALREALGATAQSFPQGGRRRKLRLDEEGGIPLKPDLSWWAGPTCIFVGDCKYKRTMIDSVPNADLYQLLAYTTALALDDGLLIYAAGEHSGGAHTVKHAGKRLHILTLDLAGEPAAVLAQIEQLASQVRWFARRTLKARAA